MRSCFARGSLSGADIALSGFESQGERARVGRGEGETCINGPARGQAALTRGLTGYWDFLCSKVAYVGLSRSAFASKARVWVHLT